MPAPACIPVPAAEAVLEVSERLRLAGPRALDDLEALQMLAGVTPAQAAALMSEFGSLPELCAADRAALCRKSLDRLPITWRWPQTWRAGCLLRRSPSAVC